MASSLRDKTIKGVNWSVIENVLNHGTSFIIGLVLARLLSPKEYGLIGIVGIFAGLFDAIIDSGFTNALIRKNDSDNDDYNTVFISNLFVSIFLSLLLFCSAPYISIFFKQAELTQLTRTLSCVIFINAISIIPRVLLTKQLDFKTMTKISIISNVISGLIGIIMAFCGCGVWSLVAQQIISRLMRTFLLNYCVRWKPVYSFSYARFRDIFSFAWKLMVASVINNLWKQVYSIVIGRCYDVKTLGYYSRANHMSELFSVNLTNVVQRVSFPVLSNIQNEEENLKKVYRKVIKFSMFVSFICMLGMSAVAKPLIVVLIGEKWLPCVPLLQIICFQMVLYPVHAINLNMLQVKGRSDLFLRLEIIKKTVGIIPIILGVFVGIYSMLIGSVIIGGFAYWINSYYSGRLINYSFLAQVKDIFPSFGISLIMFMVLFLMSFVDIPSFFLLILQMTVGAGIVISLCEFIKLEEYVEVKQLLKPFINIIWTR